MKMYKSRISYFSRAVVAALSENQHNCCFLSPVSASIHASIYQAFPLSGDRSSQTLSVKERHRRVEVEIRCGQTSFESASDERLERPRSRSRRRCRTSPARRNSSLSYFTANTDGGQSSNSSLWRLQDIPKDQNLLETRRRLRHAPAAKTVARTYFWLQH